MSTTIGCLTLVDIVMTTSPMGHSYWTTQRQGETVITNNVQYMPRNTLNPEQRLVYDTHMGHFQQRDAPLFACRLTAAAAPGSRTWSKSYPLISNRHLSVKSLPLFARRRRVLQVIKSMAKPCIRYFVCLLTANTDRLRKHHRFKQPTASV